MEKSSKTVQRHLSTFSTWDLKNTHINGLSIENIGTHLAIDEVALSQENFIPLLLIKKQKAKGSLVAIVAGTKTEQVIEQVSKINLKDRQVIEITLDMANSMK
jgi:3-keto-L-gulonate-6-phosphate decarboxylase